MSLREKKKKQQADFHDAEEFFRKDIAQSVSALATSDYVFRSEKNFQKIILPPYPTRDLCA